MFWYNTIREDAIYMYSMYSKTLQTHNPRIYNNNGLKYNFEYCNLISQQEHFVMISNTIWGF